MEKEFDYFKYLRNNPLLTEAMDNTGGVSFDDEPKPPSKPQLDLYDIEEEIFYLWDLYFDDNREGIEKISTSRRNKTPGTEFAFNPPEEGDYSAFVADVDNYLEENNIVFDVEGEDVIMIYDPKRRGTDS